MIVGKKRENKLRKEVSFNSVVHASLLIVINILNSHAQK
jgi:hypothetical protein